MNKSSVSPSAVSVIKHALDSVEEALKFGKVADPDRAAVKAAVALGIAAPQTKAPFSRKEMKDVPAGTWPHFLSALDEPLDRNELTRMRDAAPNAGERERCEKKMRFAYFLLNAVRNALWQAHKKAAVRPNGHLPLTADRLRAMLDGAVERNMKGDPKQDRRALGEYEATLTACRWAVGLVVRAGSELTGNEREELMGTVRLKAIQVITADHKGDMKRGYEGARNFMQDAERFHVMKLRQAPKAKREQAPVTQKSPAPAVELSSMDEVKPEAVETCTPFNGAKVEAAKSDTTPPPSSKPPSRRRIGHKISPRDGTVEVIYAS